MTMEFKTANASLLPALAICMTPFLRIVVVLSMIRHAFGMPETPPNQVLVSLALFLTLLTMTPTLSRIEQDALSPFLAGELSVSQALDRGAGPARAFMLRQVHDQDIKAVYDMSRQALPRRAAHRPCGVERAAGAGHDDGAALHLVPADQGSDVRAHRRLEPRSARCCRKLQMTTPSEAAEVPDLAEAMLWRRLR